MHRQTRLFSLLFGFAATLVMFAACAARAASFTGHVVDAKGNPVAGASVTFFHPKIGPDNRVVVSTGADGAFSVDLPDGDQSLSNVIIDAKGFGVGGGLVYQTNARTFALAAPAQLGGQVVDAANRPVAGAMVRVTYVQTGQSGFALQAQDTGNRFAATTDASGHYKIDDLPAGAMASVQIDDPKYGFAVDRVTLPGTATPLAAIPAAVITGRVMHSDGTPAVGVNIFAVRTDHREGYANATTGSDGSYTLASLAEASYSIIVRNRGQELSYGVTDPEPNVWFTAGLKTVEAVKGKTTAAPDIVMTHGALISGTVADAVTGKPIAGATVTAQEQSGTMGGYSSVTDPHGSYSIRTAPGTLTVSVNSAGDYITSRQNAKAAAVADGDSATVSFRLELGTGFSATMTDEAGKPVTGIPFWLDAKDRGGDWNTYQGPTEVFPTASGALEVHGVAQGTYTLTAGEAWQVKSPATLTLPTTGTVVLVLRALPTTSLTGRVVDTDGHPVSGAQLSISVQYNIGSNGSSTGRFEQILSDASGKFELDGLTSDDTYVNAGVSKSGYKLVSGATTTGKDGAFTMVTPVLAPINGSLIGIVRDSNGAPAPGAWVVVAGDGPGLPVQTDKTGHFTLTGLTNGPAEIHAAYKSQAADKTVAITASARAVLTLDDAGQPAAPGDLARGEKVIEEEMKAAAGSQNFDNKSWIISDIGAFSPDFALATMEANQAADDTGIQEIIEARAVTDPVDAANWALRHGPAISDPTDRAMALIDAGLAIAEYKPAVALQLYNLAEPLMSGAAGQRWGGVVLMSAAALAAALKLPEADALIDRALKVDHADDASHNYSTESEFPGYMARGDIATAKKLADDLPDKTRSEAYDKILANSGYAGPEAADVAFQIITPDPARWWSDENTMAGMERSLQILGQRDPAALLRVARLYAGSQAGAVSMLDAADAAPMPDADALYQEAFDATADNASQGCSPTMVAAHAWLRDKKLGIDLFAKAEKRISGGYETGMIPQAAADFAFYYARIDPAFSRMMIERQWASDSAPTVTNPSFYERGDALAMVAVDQRRATEMAHAIPDEYERIDSLRRIAQYIMEPQQVRETLPFDAWSGGTIQLPNVMPTMW